MQKEVKAQFIDSEQIDKTLVQSQAVDNACVRDILAKAKELHGLEMAEVAALSAVTDPGLIEEMFAAARQVKQEIYGSRLVLFAPLYVSNRCTNECTYCAFRARNQEVTRRTLTQDEIAAEIRVLLEQGHKRVLLVAGESYPDKEGFNYVLKSVDTIYKTTTGRGGIRRVNVNVAPLTVEQFRELKAADIGAYQIFQETYHRETYARVHVAGMKRNYDWRVTAVERAMEAGIRDVGIGPLFGLADWRYELLALMQHIHHLELRFGCGPHTISVPRLEPAVGSEVASHPPHAVSDADFLKIIAILRLAVPSTGLVMSTRESAEIRRKSYQIGISQTSAGSRTDPGGYEEVEGDFHSSQFQVGDNRPLDEVVREVAAMGFIPSFCTACYRSGRTGKDFMDLAKPGAIKYNCEPNALSTFREYLDDYASPETRAAGEQLIAEQLAKMDGRQQRIVTPMLARVNGGQRDVFV
ncbi:MAG TPA: [FeFe] hydrogenase H-cluster radical SAM maturase HydG [Clostridia bacterium]|nr:[FeFe] hydrogenase H-cluster radical SAM maturase HydG [Clostridia bacterium]